MTMNAIIAVNPQQMQATTLGWIEKKLAAAIAEQDEAGELHDQLAGRAMRVDHARNLINKAAKRVKFYEKCKAALAAGLAAEGADNWIAENLIELLAVFSAQGHSGFSAPWAICRFEKLARFEPLGPLTGADDEWSEYSAGMFQNRRCSHVFKDADRFGGQAYDSRGRIFREPNGGCFTSGESAVPITFPYTPTSVYVVFRIAKVLP